MIVSSLLLTDFIINLLKKYKIQVEEWNIYIDSEDKYFGEISKAFAEYIENSLNFWEMLPENEKKVGTFLESCLDSTENHREETTSNDNINDSRISEEGGRIKNGMIVIVLVIFILLLTIIFFVLKIY